MFLWYRGSLYCTKNRKGEIGVPGGKREPMDSSMFETLRREFTEETGRTLPIKDYKYFEWGDLGHSIRIYHHTINEDDMDLLYIGPINNPGCKEVETLWVAATECHDETHKWRWHIQQGLKYHLIAAKDDQSTKLTENDARKLRAKEKREAKSDSSDGETSEDVEAATSG